MHKNVIRTNKRYTQAQSNYTNTKLKAWFRHLLRHQARKRSESIVPPLDLHGGVSPGVLAQTTITNINKSNKLTQKPNTTIIDHLQAHTNIG